MTIEGLLAATRAAGIELRAERGRLLYDAPAGVLTPEFRKVLSARKAELLAHLTGSGRVPLSFAQQSLWFLHELYPGDTSASEQFAIRLEGPLVATVLLQAWNALLQRHAILRTTFAAEGGDVWQVAAPARPGLLPVTNLADDGPALLALAGQALRVPFDLTRGPLLRPELCRVAADLHVLLVTAHHIVADGLSVPVIRAELAALYGAFVAGSDAILPPLELEYADLARAQSLSVAHRDAARAAALDWWRGTLGNLPPSALRELVRPTRNPARNPEKNRGTSRRCEFELEPGLAAGIRDLARASGATPYMALLATFRVLLGRLTGQHDLVIGTPMTLRYAPELRDLIGCLVNPVALRESLDVAASFRSQLERERTVVLDALQHRDVPFSQVVEAVGPCRQVGQHPLFQVLFSYEPEAPAVAESAHVRFGLMSIPADRASYFDLECAVRDAGEGQPLRGYFAWSTRVLEDWVAEQLPGIFRSLLTDIVARPDAPVGTLALLSPAVREQVLGGWNATAAPIPYGVLLHEPFLAQARRAPEAPALRAAACTWSYGELAERSAQLAAQLGARGVQPGTPVGLCLGRSVEAIVAMMGVLRVGGILVPLDPGYPAARLQFIARDAGVGLVLTDPAGLESGLAAQFEADGAAVVVVDSRIDVPAATVGAPSGAIPPASVAPEGAPTVGPPATSAGDPAVILYTSGSTGTPKGAVTTHLGAVHRCAWMWARHGFGPADVFAFRTSPNFIDSLWEIFGALGHGIPLVIAPDDVATDALRLPDFLREEGVTHLVLVPSLLRAMLDGVPGDELALPALRSCISSGEPLEPALVRRFQLALPGAVLLNTYGTSEIWDATCYDTRELRADAARVPIGRPIANATAYVLDGAGQPLPPGFPGELCVGGIGIGPGYWQRPELTAGRFVPDPFARRPAVARLYRTGDRARWLADGNLECLGRLDAQFKLRGFRIEPAEIESALAAHSGVAGAVVGIRGEGGDSCLVAGIVPVGAASAAISVPP